MKKSFCSPGSMTEAMKGAKSPSPISSSTARKMNANTRRGILDLVSPRINKNCLINSLMQTYRIRKFIRAQKSALRRHGKLKRLKGQSIHLPQSRKTMNPSSSKSDLSYIAFISISTGLQFFEQKPRICFVVSSLYSSCATAITKPLRF